MFLYSTGSFTLEVAQWISLFFKRNSPLTKKKFVEVKGPEVSLLCCKHRLMVLYPIKIYAATSIARIIQNIFYRLRHGVGQFFLPPYRKCQL